MVIQLSTTYAHVSTLKTVEILMHTAKLLPTKKPFLKKFQVQKKSETHSDEAPMELCPHGRSWHISHYFPLLASQRSTLWAERKTEALDMLFPAASPPKVLHWNSIPFAVGFKIQEHNSHIADFKMLKQLSFPT